MEKTLLKLKEIRETLIKNELDTNIIDELITEQEKTVMFSKVVNPSTKKALKKRLSFLDKLRKNDKHLFAYASVQNINNHDYVIITDTYKAIGLYENDGNLPLFEDLTEEERKNNHINSKVYPDFRNFFDLDNLQEIKKLKYEDVVKTIKLNKDKENTCNSLIKKFIPFTFNKEFFYNLCEIKEIYELFGAKELTFLEPIYTKNGYKQLYKQLYMKDENNNIAVLALLNNKNVDKDNKESYVEL